MRRTSSAAIGRGEGGGEAGTGYIEVEERGVRDDGLGQKLGEPGPHVVVREVQQLQALVLLQTPQNVAGSGLNLLALLWQRIPDNDRTGFWLMRCRGFG